MLTNCTTHCDHIGQHKTKMNIGYWIYLLHTHNLEMYDINAQSFYTMNTSFSHVHPPPPHSTIFHPVSSSPSQSHSIHSDVASLPNLHTVSFQLSSMQNVLSSQHVVQPQHANNYPHLIPV